MAIGLMMGDERFVESSIRETKPLVDLASE
jgi:hypothetical protein